METLEGKTGAFVSSLTRNNKQIRADRALSIAEDTQLLYQRTIQDLEVKIKRLKRDQENMLDLSPTDAMSLKLASDFHSDEYVAKDVAIGLEIRDSEITLKIAKERYEYLFGAGEAV